MATCRHRTRGGELDEPYAIAMTDTEIHRASCHCQAIVFSVKTPKILDPVRCDCSHCSKLGITWGYVPPGDLILEKGKGTFAEYAYGDENVKQLSCGKCGTFIARGKSGSSWPEEEQERVLFNIRTIRDIDLHDLEPYIKFRKRDISPAYIPAPALERTFPAPATGEEHKTYHGSCHCQAVRFLVRSKRLRKGEVEISDCNCSICGGNGVVWIYPKHGKYHLSPSSAPHITRYAYTPTSPSQNGFHFCSTCHCTVYESREADDGIGLNLRLVEFGEEDRKEAGEMDGNGKRADLVRGLEGEGLAEKVDDRSTKPEYALP